MTVPLLRRVAITDPTQMMPSVSWKSCGVVFNSISRPRLLLGRLPPLQAYAYSGKQRRRYTQSEDDYIAQRRQEGATYGNIAKELGRLQHSVAGRYRAKLLLAGSHTASSQNIAGSNTTAASPSKTALATRDMLSPDESAQLKRIEQLVNEGRSISSIAEQLDMSRYAVTALFHSYNPRRKQREWWSEDEARKALSLSATGHSYTEIAAALQRSQAGVYNFLRRSRMGPHHYLSVFARSWTAESRRMPGPGGQP